MNITLYLPDNLFKARRALQTGYAYGWRGEQVVVVAGILDEPYERAADRVEIVGRSLSTSFDIVGVARGEGEAAIAQGEGSEGGLFVFILRKNLPPSITSSSPAQSPPRIVYYRPTKRHEILSLVPIPLHDRDHHPLARSTSRNARGGLDFSPDKQVLKSDLEPVIDWINLSSIVVKRVNRQSPTRRLPFILSKSITLVARIARAGFTFHIAILSFRLPTLGSLLDHSNAARQIATRLELLSSAPGRYSSYLSLRSEPSPTSQRRLKAHADYIQFWNTIWLFANDLIVGYALSAFVRDNAEDLSRLLEIFVQTYISGYSRELLVWLNDWPGGVKLNSELSSLICESFLFLSRLWEDFVLVPFLPRLPALLNLFSIFGFVGGASLLLAFASDLLHLLTFPFFSCYVAATLVYRWSLVGLSALFNVFRGKKYNPLRGRTEPASYSVDALLLGTILFVTLIFLFPTILAYYLAFASSRLTLVAVQTGFGVAIQALNAFPLFALMLRFKNSARLPFDVQFRHCTEERHWSTPHLHLENRPLPLSLVLADLMSLAKAFFSPKAQLTLLSKLCTGKVILSTPLRSPSSVSGQRQKE